jgi:DNA-binding NtrC family response regulator
MGSVLIVDDDDSFATALARIVEHLGHTSERAVDGQDGLLKLHDGDFDVVIADLKMPRMNGVEFIRESRRIDKDVAVMVITGYADLNSAVETLNLGAYDYLEKPVTIERLQAALDRGMERRRLATQLNFSKGLIWLIVISVPLWIVLGFVLAYVWKK